MKRNFTDAEIVALRNAPGTTLLDFARKIGEVPAYAAMIYDEANARLNPKKTEPEAIISGRQRNHIYNKHNVTEDELFKATKNCRKDFAFSLAKSILIDNISMRSVASQYGTSYNYAANMVARYVKTILKLRENPDLNKSKFHQDNITMDEIKVAVKKAQNPRTESFLIAVWVKHLPLTTAAKNNNMTYKNGYNTISNYKHKIFENRKVNHL